MSLTSQAAEFERESLEKLRAEYTARGFTFIPHPDREQTPEFLGSYRPDAIAQKSGANVVIEIKQAANPAVEGSLNQIRKLFEGHPDWQFVVSYGGSDALTAATIPPASEDAIRSRMDEVRVLIEHGQRRGAFVLGWSLLEAALHRLEGEQGKRPRSPGTVVESLGTLGYLSPVVQQQLRSLIGLRNRIVHGDVAAEPSIEDLATLVEAVDEALS
ncbi:hypothetical protein [Rhizobium leguminosarum]